MYIYYAPEFDVLTFFSTFRGDVSSYHADAFSLELERAGDKRKTEIHYIGIYEN